MTLLEVLICLTLLSAAGIAAASWSVFITDRASAAAIDLAWDSAAHRLLDAITDDLRTGDFDEVEITDRIRFEAESFSILTRGQVPTVGAVGSRNGPIWRNYSWDPETASVSLLNKDGNPSKSDNPADFRSGAVLLGDVTEFATVIDFEQQVLTISLVQDDTRAIHRTIQFAAMRGEGSSR